MTVSIWNDTEPFALGDESGLNGSGRKYVAYLFADSPDDGIKCDSFTLDSTKTIECGFKPGWLLVKPYSALWCLVIVDNKRE